MTNNTQTYEYAIIICIIVDRVINIGVISHFHYDLQSLVH